MPDITATYHVDIAKVQEAFASVEAMGKRAAAAVNGAGGSGAFRSQRAGAQKAAQSFAVVKKEADAAATAASRAGGAAAGFGAKVRRAGTAAAAVSAIVVALVALNRRFPVIGQVAAKSFAVIRQTAAAAMVTTGKFAVTLNHLKSAAGAAVAIYGLARAFRTLRGSAAGVESIKVPKVPSGGMGLGMKAGIAGAALGGLALGAGAFTAVKEGIGRAISAAAEMEQTEIAFEVLLGGVGAAKQTLGEIRELAEKTPLQFADLAGAGRQLLAFKESAETLPDTLRRIGDISSGIGAPVREIAELYGKARVQGTLFAEDINQLTNRGIDVITEFANQLGVGTDEVKKMGAEGKISFENLRTAFESLTDEGGAFGGMLEKQSLTLAGLWSTLKDRVQQAFTAMGSPINEAIKPILEKAVEMAGHLVEHFVAIGEKIAAATNFLHAFFTQLSAGQMLAAVGLALELAFLKALDVLARGLQAIYAASQDAGFMSGLAEQIRGLGVVLKLSLLAALQSVFAALGQMKGLGHLGAAADRLGETRGEIRLAEAERRKRLRESGGAEPERDLLQDFKEKFAEASGVFGPEIKKAAAGLKKVMSPVEEFQARLLAEQQRRDEDGGGGARGSGEMIGGAGAALGAAGAFQQAKNLIAGKTINEVVAQEAVKTNSQLGKLAAGQDRVRSAVERVEKAIVREPKRAVEVEVVPTF